MEGESAATTLVVAAVAKAAGKDIGSAPVVTVYLFFYFIFFTFL